MRSIEATRPDREPDLKAPANGRKYAFEYWEEENVIAFDTMHGKYCYSLFNGGVTPQEYIAKILKDSSHSHHKSVNEWVIEKILLGEENVTR